MTFENQDVWRVMMSYKQKLFIKTSYFPPQKLPVSAKNTYLCIFPTQTINTYNYLIYNIL